MEQRTAFMALNLIPSLPPVMAAKLLEVFNGNPARILASSRAELTALHGLERPWIEHILEEGLIDRAREEAARTVARGWRVITPADPDYPRRLLGQIHDPPLALYVAGSVEALSRDGVAVVGSRLATPYGRHVARSLARDLVGRGAAVFSGLARGIDAEAHRGALEGGGVTVAVLGTGLDVVYPRENRRLADEIVERGGAVVTEMPLGSGPFPRHFPLRNRIISGLSWGVMVVEAGEKSGSLITARLGMEQGREVFAVPGNITSPTSEGSNALIAGGAKLVRCAGDVVDELPPPVRAVLEARAVDAAATAAGDGAAGGANGRDGDADKAKGSRLEGKTAALYGALSVDSPVGIDELAARLKMPAHELHPHLFQLELSGRARPLPGGRYVRTE